MILVKQQLRSCALAARSNVVNVQPVRFASGNNHYAVLGLKVDAAHQDVKEAFYKLSKEFHPDRNNDDAAALRKFKEISAAYEILGNAEHRKAYDEQQGFARQSANEQHGPGATGSGSRRRGTFRNGRFVDSELPPEMRNIQYDLSPERMEKVWARYRDRWNRVEEKERIQQMEQRKAEFRRRVEERRQNMPNMTIDEREEFLFKLRMLRPDAHEVGNGPASRTKQQQQQSSTSNKTSWFASNQENIRLNQKWREQEREKTLEALQREEREQERQMQKAMWGFGSSPPSQPDDPLAAADEVARKRHRLDDLIYEGLLDENQLREARMRRDKPLNFDEEDPFLIENSNKKKEKVAENWREMLELSMERSSATWSEIKTARPFSFYARSFRHGIWETREVRAGHLSLVALSLLFLVLYALDAGHDRPDNISVQTVIETRQS